MVPCSPDDCSENCTQIIIDLRTNPGGYIEYLFGIMEALFGTDKTNTTGFSYQSAKLRLRADTKLPYLLVAARRPSLWDWASWSDENEVPFTNATGKSFFSPTETLAWGFKGVKGRYSKAFTDGTPRVSDVFGNVKSILGTKKIALLSDGQCHSACGSFSFAMRYRLNAKLVTLGGFPGTPLQFSGGAGSIVIFDVVQQIAQNFPASVNNRADAPGEFFSNRVQLSMAMTFSQQPGVPVPLDFAPLTADLHFDHSPQTIADPFSIWVDAAKVFE